MNIISKIHELEEEQIQAFDDLKQELTVGSHCQQPTWSVPPEIQVAHQKKYGLVSKCKCPEGTVVAPISGVWTCTNCNNQLL